MRLLAQTSSNDPDGDFVYAPNDNCPDTANPTKPTKTAICSEMYVTMTEMATLCSMTPIIAQMSPMQTKPIVTVTKSGCL